jgi:hypothetical protein
MRIGLECDRSQRYAAIKAVHADHFDAPGNGNAEHSQNVKPPTFFNSLFASNVPDASEQHL